jgi:SagB-type dehydrogenase family enzyme
MGHDYQMPTKEVIDYSVLKGYGEPYEEFFSDQDRGVLPPTVEKAIDPQQSIYPLPAAETAPLQTENIFDCIRKRQSHRVFRQDPISLVQLSFLLWAGQGIRKTLISKKTGQINAFFRHVPSAGARNPLETYIAVLRVQDLGPGIYRYSALQHALIKLYQVDNLEQRLVQAALGQDFVGRAAAVLCWAAIPYRTAWRYGPRACKYVLLDAGHAGQNTHLAAEALGLGACMIAAYSQPHVDQLFGLDGAQEFGLYLAPVGVPG